MRILRSEVVDRNENKALHSLPGTLISTGQPFVSLSKTIRKAQKYA